MHGPLRVLSFPRFRPNLPQEGQYLCTGVVAVSKGWDDRMG